MSENLKWREDYALGVAVIDNAHKELFRITRRLLHLNRQNVKRQWIAEQGLSFLKNYVVQHFSEEEEYMRKIRYAQFEPHVSQHQLLKEVVLPRMEKQLRDSRYSQEAMQRFLLIILVWLDKHILEHDKAICVGAASAGVKGAQRAQ